MSIDPDVQVLLDAQNARIEALENAGPMPLPTQVVEATGAVPVFLASAVGDVQIARAQALLDFIAAWSDPQ